MQTTVTAKEIEQLNLLYEVVDYRHALSILQVSNSAEFHELLDALLSLRISVDDIKSSGGNESNVPKLFASSLYKEGWKETKISGDLLIKLIAKNHDGQGYLEEERTIFNFLDGHRIDFVKNRVAFDVEWNSKDQTFDRDLFAFGAFYQANIIDAAVLVHVARV